jgi:predicted RNA-binding protein with PIN domain
MTDPGVRLLVVDAANVVGARPDGWWRDRAGAARRLLMRISAAPVCADRSVEVVVVLEGAAKGALDGSAAPEGLRVVAADGSGDDAIVAQVAAHRGRTITVVTADRGLRERVVALGAETVGPRWLLDRIDS